jgi:carbon-monoxide dehydrogenase medium subunit
MYLSPFELDRPRSLAEALDLRSQHEDAVWYAGGTELLALMKLGLASPSRLIDVKAIHELRVLTASADEVAIGAAVTHRTLERDPDVRRRLPALAAVEHQLANVRVRNAGSLGGNLCFAEPHSDPATILLALDARVGLVGAQGPRELPIGQFLLGAFETALRPGELMTHVTVPSPDRVRHVELERRAFRERPVVNVTVADTDDGVTLAVGAAGPVAVRVPEVERLLSEAAREGRLEDVATTAGELAAGAVSAYDEAGASTEFKEHLVAVLVTRAVRRLAAA